jgi:hypothetical protein
VRGKHLRVLQRVEIGCLAVNFSNRVDMRACE